MEAIPAASLAFSTPSEFSNTLLVAGLIDELDLVELTDERVEPHCLEHVSAGQVVKAMI